MKFSGNESLIGIWTGSEPDITFFDHAGDCLESGEFDPKNNGTVIAREQKKTRKCRTNSSRYELNLIIYTKSLKNSPEYHRCSLVLRNYLHMLS